MDRGQWCDLGLSFVATVWSEETRVAMTLGVEANGQFTKIDHYGWPIELSTARCQLTPQGGI
jgi:hypothetical protein